MQRGTLVLLPNGRTAIVIDSHDGESNVFTGRRRDMTPIVDTYVDCELALTGQVYARLAALVVEEMNHPKASGNSSAAIVTGI